MVIRSKKRQLCDWYCLLTVLLGSTITGNVFGEGPEEHALLESVFKDWQSRQSILKSVRYVLTGTTEFKDAQLPPGNPNRPLRYVLLLDLARKRYRLESSEDVTYVNGKDDPKQWEYRRRISTSAYDGDALQSLRHRKANRIEDDVADLAIGKGDLGPGAQFGSEVWPIFFAHGIVATIHAPLLVDKLPKTHDPEDFEFRGWQLLRNQKCLFVKTKPLTSGPVAGGDGTSSDELWINPKHGSTILRYVYYNDSNPWTRLDIFWKKTAYGWWIDHWSDTWSNHGQVRRKVFLRVSSFDANPEVADGDFILPAEPGMKVTIGEYSSPENMKTYRISPSGAWDELSSNAKGPDSRPVGRGIGITWTAASVLAMVALLIYALRQRRKKTAH